MKSMCGLLLHILCNGSWRLSHVAEKIMFSFRFCDLVSSSNMHCLAFHRMLLALRKTSRSNSKISW
jgi:hypothetical protein